MKIHHLLSLAVLAAIMTGCGKTEQGTAAPASSGGIPETLIVSAITGEPMTPTAAKASAKAGDQIVLTGHIAGRAKPFVDGRAIFTLVDTALPLCDEECGNPWDLCCEESSDIAAAAVTVQVVDADGNPLKQSLEGPLKPGQTIAVTGKVKQNDDNSFVINAEQIAVLK
ncbi:MAG: hypothetical protein ACI8W8_000260 [Rhodothermales bacterium]|jgi:hypothetical protein